MQIVKNVGNTAFREGGPWMAALAYTGIFFYYPLGRLLSYAFHMRDFAGGGITSEVTLNAFRTLDFAAFASAASWTVVVCTPAVLLVVGLGAWLATSLELLRSPRVRRWAWGLMIGLIAGDGLVKALMYRRVFGLSPSPVSFVLLSTLMLVPMSTVAISLGYRRLDSALAPAARDLGASDWVLARRVLLPANLAALQSATLLAGVLLFFNLIYAEVFLGGKHFLLATLIKHQFLENSNWPSAVIMLVVGFGVVCVILWACVRLVSILVTRRLA